LDIFPSTITTWGAWQKTHPETMIISAASLGQDADQINDPYSSYYLSPIPGISGADINDNRLPSKTLVVGLFADNHARAFPFEQVKTEGIINDQIATTPIVLLYDSTLQSSVAYRSALKDKFLRFEKTNQIGLIRDRETGSLWEIRTGKAIQGPLSGTVLTRINAPLVFWFAWANHYPNTEVYNH
ncbi:MAG: DUF3179 domain-containing protein, partial [Chloroflexi bacterium]|nr:DUF3179 domain-containing protein [Chloroflexota bacterium]